MYSIRKTRGGIMVFDETGKQPTIFEAAQSSNRNEQRAEQAEVERDQLRDQLKQVTDALDTLFDAHYGTAYHHCGDGDGLTEDEVKLIVGIVKKNRGEK